MRFLAYLAAVFALAGCAASPYGNHAGASDDVNQKLAVASIRQLAAMYPPARTQFNLRQSPNDAFGSSLLSLLRNRGYAILEQSAYSEDIRSGLDLRYVVDAPASTNLYLVTIYTGTRSLSRAYTLHRGSVAPVGPWIRGE